MRTVPEDQAFDTAPTPRERRLNFADEMKFLAHRIGRIELAVLGIVLALIWLNWTVGSKADEINAALRACS